MTKILRTLLLVVSGIIAVLFVGNLLVHYLFYVIDGNVGKFLSPPWIILNAIMVFFCVVFGWTLKKERGVS